MKSMTIENLMMASALWLGFLALLFVLRIVVPGPVHHGQKLADGTRKAYKLNAFYILLIVCAAIAVGQVTHLFSLSIVHRLVWPLVVVVNVVAFIMTGWMCVRGRPARRGGGGRC